MRRRGFLDSAMDEKKREEIEMVKTQIRNLKIIVNNTSNSNSFYLKIPYEFNFSIFNIMFLGF